MPYPNAQNLASLDSLLSQLEALLAPLHAVPPVATDSFPTITLPPPPTVIQVTPFSILPVTVYTTYSGNRHDVFLVHPDATQGPSSNGDLASGKVGFFGQGSVSGLAFVPLFVLYQYGQPSYGYFEARASGNSNRVQISFTY